MKTPKEFEDLFVRDQIAHMLVQHIDASQADMESHREVWDQVMAIYNDDPEQIPTSFEWPKEVKRPYNVALIQPRVDALVGDVVGGMLQANPFWVNRLIHVSQSSNATDTGQALVSESEQMRERAEKTLDFAFRRAGLDRRLREAGMEAVLKGRGVLRLRFESIGEAGSDHNDVPLAKGVNHYAGLSMDTVRLEDFVIYPSYAESVQQARTVGHAFTQRLRTIRSRQASGEYFDDVVLSNSGDTTTLVGDAEDEGKICYDLLFRYAPEEGGEEEWFRATLAYSDRKLLAIERYPYRRPWYFAPAFKLEPNRFLPERSIAAKAIEMQTLMNDCMTLNMVGSLAASLRTVIATGVHFDQQNVRLGLGEVLAVRQTPSHLMETTSAFDPGATIALIPLIERMTDAVFRMGAPGLGSFSSAQRTATEHSIVAEGQSRGYSEYRSMFADELNRMAHFGAHLIADNFAAFKSFWGGAVPSQSAADLRLPSLFEVNSTKVSTSPEVLIQKIEMALGAAERLGVDLNREAAFAAVLNALELGVDVRG